MVNKGQSWDAIPTVTTRAHCNGRVLSAPPLKAPHCPILSNLCQQGHLRKPEPSLPHNLSSSLLTELTLSPVSPSPPRYQPEISTAPSPAGFFPKAQSSHHVPPPSTPACHLLPLGQRVIQVDQKVVETQKPGAQRPAADVLRAEGTSSGRSSQPPALQPGAQLQRWTRHSRRLKKLPWAISDVSLTGCKPCLPPARSSLRRPWEPGQWEPGPVAYLAGGGTRTPIHSLTHT
nr:uncharacterized protein LOC114082934 [Marmota flaviventris]